MKMSKRSHNRGYFIDIKIGNYTYSSWWSSPQKRGLNFEKEYLNGRYPVITTDKRAKEFSRLYAKLWENEFETNI